MTFVVMDVGADIKSVPMGTVWHYKVCEGMSKSGFNGDFSINTSNSGEILSFAFVLRTS